MTDRTPLYEAEHATRYERQALIREYQEAHGCRLVVMRDVSFPRCVPLFEETPSVLRDLGLPRERQNERSALTLLAVLGLSADRPLCQWALKMAHFRALNVAHSGTAPAEGA